MAQYKVPQDVEADDKLLGPFTFRQFVYLMIMGGFIGVAFALFNIFPLFALLAVPFIIFFAVLALPLKKDQPMETYLAAVISFHLKPNKRFWNPGQRESTVEIIAPKKVDAPLTRDISTEEASNRLSFLANIVDTEGYAVKGDLVNAPMRAKFLEEATSTPDILDINASPVINQMLAEQQNEHHQELVQQMRQAIRNTEYATGGNNDYYSQNSFSTAQAINPAVMAPQPTRPYPYNQTSPYATIAPTPPTQQSVNPTVQAQLRNLASNTDYSVETISKEANRIEHQSY